MEPGASSSSSSGALERPAAQLTVPDVYDIAALLGHEFERVIDRFGCESLVGLVHKVVRVLELLEALVALVNHGGAGQEAEELRRELERLRQERSDRLRQERKQQQELELVEDVWRGEVQDLLNQISQLQAENRRLTASLPLKDSSIQEEDSLKQEGMSEKEKRMMHKLEDLVEKQRDAIRAKDHELTLRNEDVEALQMQQHRLIKINQDLRHRMAVMEAQSKALIRQKVELEAAAQAQQQDLGALQLEATRLRKEIQSLELERELTEIAETSLVTSGTSPLASALAAPSTLSRQESSVWAECGADRDFLANAFEQDEDLYFLPRSSSAGGLEKRSSDDEKSREIFLKSSPKEEAGEETDSPDEEPDKARFTLQELRDVLQEKNELKAQVFMLQEELAYYQSEEEFEDGVCSLVCAPSPPPSPSPSERPESGIRRLIFTAIMPMVAAGLIADDPTLLPIRRLLSSV